MQRMMGGGGGRPSPAEMERMQAELATLDPRALENLPKELQGAAAQGPADGRCRRRPHAEAAGAPGRRRDAEVSGLPGCREEEMQAGQSAAGSQVPETSVLNPTPTLNRQQKGTQPCP